MDYLNGGAWELVAEFTEVESVTPLAATSQLKTPYVLETCGVG